MTAKISPRHRQAFIEALAETGNYVIAAAEVRVSTDWAFRLRRRDAEFDAACREARERARVRLALRYAASTSSAATQDERVLESLRQKGGELVVERGNGRVVQLKRSAGKRWTGETERRFLAALAGSCNVRLSAAEVGVSVPSAYKRRRNDPGFAKAWDQAIDMGYARLEEALIQNACHFLNPADAPVPDQLLEGMSVAHAIDVARMNWGKVRGLRRREEGRTD